jgi:hypothetical protein
MQVIEVTAPGICDVKLPGLKDKGVDLRFYL